MMKHFTLVILALFGLLSTLSAQDIIDSLSSQGETRLYRVHLPNGQAPTEPVPLVFALHGLGDNMNNFSGVGFSQVGDTANFIAVYPQAVTLPLLNANGWRIGTPVDGPESDVVFLSELLDTLMATYMIDTQRVYATGFSMGGFMSHILGCQLSDKIAAIAPHSGTISPTNAAACTGSRKVPAMHIHGTSDGTIAYDGGTFFGVYTFNGAEATIQMWADIDSCDGAVDSTRISGTYNIDKFYYTDCKDSTEVILYRVLGMDHTWLNIPQFRATPEIWNFFARHKLPKATEEPIDTSTGIASIATDNLVKVFPNPSTGVFTVENLYSQPLNCQVYDMMGRMVYGADLTEERTTVSLSNNSKGIYLLKVLNKETGKPVGQTRLIIE